MPPVKRSSTPRWLLPPPIRRFREHLREIRRLAGEIRQEGIDARLQMVEMFAALGNRMAEAETIARHQAEAISLIEARLEQLAGQSVKSASAQAVVLAYHRVAETTSDPFELAVTPQQFDAHLQLLSTLGEPLSVSELRHRIADGTLPDVSFTVTFDDGYADNLHTAKPILERYGIPATVFLATDYIDGQPFWWDALAQLVLSEESHGHELTLTLDGTSRTWQLEEETVEHAYHEVWELLRPLDEGRRRNALADLRSQLGRELPSRDRSLTVEEVHALVSGGLIDVGAHTRTHPVLTSLTDEAGRAEIVESKKWIEAHLGRPVIAFAYPYGIYGARDVEIVRQAGFEIAFSVAEEVATPGCDRLQVPRVQVVGQWDAAELERTITRLLGAALVPAGRVPSSSQPSEVDLGDLRRVTPVSRDWGLERGRPVDRYYIERFLSGRAGAIRGRALEMGEPRYTTMFGGDRVTLTETLDVMEDAAATYTCRLEEGDAIPSGTYDCIVCTQVLQVIYDVRGALRTLHRILKPGGDLLLTVPGITPIHGGDAYGDAWHWSFTEASVSRLCGNAFGKGALDVEVFGNVLAASAFLYGLADSELTQQELDHFDPDYPVIIGIHARRHA